MSSQPNRGRRAFAATVFPIAALTVLLPRRLARALGHAQECPQLPSSVGTLFNNTNSARVVGLEYLRHWPSESDVPTLLSLLSLEHLEGRRELSAPERERTRAALRLRIRRDFEEERVVSVQGWILSITEARLCALSALA